MPDPALHVNRSFRRAGRIQAATSPGRRGGLVVPRQLAQDIKAHILARELQLLAAGGSQLKGDRRRFDTNAIGTTVAGVCLVEPLEAEVVLLEGSVAGFDGPGADDMEHIIGFVWGREPEGYSEAGILLARHHFLKPEALHAAPHRAIAASA